MHFPPLYSFVEFHSALQNFIAIVKLRPTFSLKSQPSFGLNFIVGHSSSFPAIHSPAGRGSISSSNNSFSTSKLLSSEVADMSRTLDASMTDPDEQTHHSDWELMTIGDLVVWHRMPFLSVRRLTQLNSPRWSMWSPSNIARISKARTLDDTRDWYFPIIVKKEKAVTVKAHPDLPLKAKLHEQQCDEENLYELPVKDVWSSWCGIWHSSAQHASETASLLPPMTHLPHEWLHFSVPREDIIASAGGLLLIKGTSGGVPIRRSKRLNPVLADSNPSSISDTTKLAAGSGPSNGPSRTRYRIPQSWQRLLVCNPLTRECRELPAADCRLLGLDSWILVYRKGVQARLVVNDEANCYQVILTLSDYVAVYTSTTTSWNCVRFPRERPWGRRISWIHHVMFVEWEYICASALVGGRLYFADVQSITGANARLPEPIRKATNAGTLRLFEVNAEAGKWQVVQEYTLRKLHIPSLKYRFENFYDMRIMPYLEIVECMGGLYAVLPAKLPDAWLIGEEQPHDWLSESLQRVDESGRKICFMPLCFYIMQLQGHGVDCGVLRIQVAYNRMDFHRRCRSLMSLANQVHWFFRNWFSCEARGSVIWVACEDYVLSFDVVSREAKTRIRAEDDGTVHQFGEETLRFAYRPSLHMKP